MNKKERKDLKETLDLSENLLTSLLEEKSIVIKEMDRINILPTTTRVNEIVYDALTHYNTEVLDEAIIRVLKKIDKTKDKLKQEA